MDQLLIEIKLGIGEMMAARRELAGGLAWLHVLCWEHPTLTPSLTHSLPPSLTTLQDGL